jgi:hypothetical protein
MQKRFAAIALLASLAVIELACGASDDPEGPPQAAGPGDGGTGSTTPGTGATVSSFGGTGGFVVDDGVGLTSSVFGSLDELIGAGGGGSVVVEPCDYGASPTCDYGRVNTCCSHLACIGAADPTNPDDTQPVQACENLISCVQTNGCSTAANPFCFLDAAGQEDENSPCAQEVYNAAHTEADGPYAHTLELINCLCGY